VILNTCVRFQLLVAPAALARRNASDAEKLLQLTGQRQNAVALTVGNDDAQHAGRTSMRRVVQAMT
jgi:hypothetical protein